MELYNLAQSRLIHYAPMKVSGFPTRTLGHTPRLSSILVSINVLSYQLYRLQQALCVPVDNFTCGSRVPAPNVPDWDIIRQHICLRQASSF